MQNGMIHIKETSIPSFEFTVLINKLTEDLQIYPELLYDSVGNRMNQIDVETRVALYIAASLEYPYEDY